MSKLQLEHRERTQRRRCFILSLIDGQLLVSAVMLVAPVRSANAQQIHDSNGVRIITYANTLQSVPVWSLAPRPLLTLGENGADFTRIVGLTRLPSGVVIVANGTPSELQYFDSSGRLKRKAGRVGSGPGEFQQLASLSRLEDTVFAAEELRGTSKFSSAGAFLGMDLRPATRFRGMASFGARFKDGTTAYFVSEPVRLSSTTDISPIFVGVYRVRNAEVIGDFFVHAVATKLQTTKTGAQQIAFGGQGSIAYWPGGLCWTGGVAFEIDCYNATGVLITRIRQTFPGEVVTARLKKEYSEKILAGPASEPGVSLERRQRVLAAQAYAKILPEIGGLKISAGGELWVRSYSVDDAIAHGRTSVSPSRPSEWTVYGLDGLVRARLTVPSRFVPFEFGTDYVLGVSRDDDDRETVTLWQLRRQPVPGGTSDH